MPPPSSGPKRGTFTVGGKKWAWRQLAKELEGEFHKGGLLRPDAVQVRTFDWIVTLDTYSGPDEGTWTRLRAPFFNPIGLHFTLTHSTFFKELGKRLFGQQDLEVGDASFDRRFVVQGNRWSLIRDMLAIEEIRDLLMAQPDMDLSVRSPRSLFGTRYPAGIDELYFQSARVIKDVERLESLFRLFALVLDHLIRRMRRFRDAVAYHVDRLEAPGGKVESGLVLWDGTPSRHRAAEVLGQHEDDRSVRALVSALRDDDERLRALAARSLGMLGRVECAPHLVPLLGSLGTMEGTQVAVAVREALELLGRGSVVEAFDAALRGEAAPFRSVPAELRGGLVEALAGCTKPSVPVSLRIDAVRALGLLGAHSALPVLRHRLTLVGHRGPEGEALTATIVELEALASLPRPASAGYVAEDRSTLPSPAGPAAPQGESLPKPVEGGSDPA